MFPDARLEHLNYCKSDHIALLLDTEFQPALNQQKGGTRRFEAKWLQEKTFRDVVQRAWLEAESTERNDGVLAKPGRMHQALHDWDYSVLKKPKKRLRQAQKEFEKAVAGVITDESEAKAKELAELIEILLEQDEIHWLQRSSANWLNLGDRNTSFFHSFATARRKKNYIKRLKNGSDIWVEGTEMLKPLVFDYFSQLFTTEVHATDPSFLEKIQPRVTSDMNTKLLAPFTADDVKKAVFSIGDFKAPGPYGIHAIFYKKFWDICGAEITTEVLQALNLGVIPVGWNDTTVVLIPKVDDPELITQFRPISLCNVIYKIVSKMLAIRLKAILPDVISPMQSAFLPGRLITDNILVAYESIHTIKNNRNGAVDNCAVKLDMHKAYDWVEWIFLENMMRKLGFHERWIN
jgi:hypothetical protein